MLGLALMLVARRRETVGWIVAGFFVVLFPGNVAQWLEGTDAFGLDTDTKRFVRLLLQPLLIAWALSTQSSSTPEAWTPRSARVARTRWLLRS